MRAVAGDGTTVLAADGGLGDRGAGRGERECGTERRQTNCLHRAPPRLHVVAHRARRHGKADAEHVMLLNPVANE
jgi:hypothetical protein